MKTTKLVLIVMGLILAACSEDKGATKDPVQVDHVTDTNENSEAAEEFVVEEELAEEEQVVEEVEVEEVIEVIAEEEPAAEEPTTPTEVADISFAGPVNQIKNGLVFTQNNSGYSVTHSRLKYGSQIEIRNNGKSTATFELLPKTVLMWNRAYMRVKYGRIYEDQLILVGEIAGEAQQVVNGSAVNAYGSPLVYNQPNQNVFIAAFDFNGMAKWHKMIRSSQQETILFAQMLKDEKLLLHVQPLNYEDSYSSALINLDENKHGYRFRNSISSNETSADSYIVQYEGPMMEATKVTRLKDNWVRSLKLRDNYLYLVDQNYVLRRLSLNTYAWEREFNSHLWHIQLEDKNLHYFDLAHFEDDSLAILERVKNTEVAEIEFRVSYYDRYLQVIASTRIEVLAALNSHSTVFNRLEILANGNVLVQGRSHDTLDVNRSDIIAPVTVLDDVQLEISPDGDLVTYSRKKAE